ncbi:UDP-N-acetylmuramoyl-tripeptide--D-alanyl-D-alanine ligase [Spongiibacter sp. IMCC21906]|uniref:UDP-N-acetylmuramoyl-tripeptide--D-alanyl-D- alanine ligase n=1 Tax=Spongiibacter sp. IMCC21906 TaxID=1620392 RepID=UPI00062E09C6|nr:UDP-N-acetylmuramoyl-tripeptide--D-alanyl-D-alanine ligase [Spongiibacter sp. IMCC21906]AKH68891.1 UDP-N-acetylmuramoyl-tripeptide--D-alanyl-D-alanine ligase [Spongiibacter sp. IMCC21906]
MTPLSLGQIAAITGGQMLGADVTVSGVCTDSRKLKTGDLFVALRGEHFDGNGFVAQAAQQGAVAAIVNEHNDSLPCVMVEDSYQALGLVARENRRRYSGPLLAITGSSGKTSTKEILASILKQCGKVYFTQGNFNNEVGVPLSLLDINSEHQYAVIEMGAAKKDDIRYLCDFAEPNVAILTNAQAAHLQGFKSLQGVAETKGEIFQSLSHDGVAVINADDGYCSLWQKMAAEAKQLLFGLEATNADVWAKDIDLSAPESSRFTLVSPQGEVAIELPLPGKHMIANALAASAAALAVGASLAQVAAGLLAVKSTSGRLNRQSVNGVTIIDDSYNANPGSVKAAIDVLAAYPQRRVLVLGTMAELGDGACQSHVDVAAYAKRQGLDAVFFSGDWAEKMADAFGASAKSFSDRDALTIALEQFIESGDTVLIKGSRSAGMDHVVAALAQTLTGEAR